MRTLLLTLSTLALLIGCDNSANPVAPDTDSSTELLYITDSNMVIVKGQDTMSGTLGSEVIDGIITPTITVSDSTVYIPTNYDETGEGSSWAPKIQESSSSEEIESTEPSSSSVEKESACVLPKGGFADNVWPCESNSYIGDRASITAYLEEAKPEVGIKNYEFLSEVYTNDSGKIIFLTLSKSLIYLPKVNSLLDSLSDGVLKTIHDSLDTSKARFSALDSTHSLLFLTTRSFLSKDTSEGISQFKITYFTSLNLPKHCEEGTDIDGDNLPSSIDPSCIKNTDYEISSTMDKKLLNELALVLSMFGVSFFDRYIIDEINPLEFSLMYLEYIKEN